MINSVGISCSNNTHLQIILKADAVDNMRNAETILENLFECSYVDEIFEEIEEEHCDEGLLPSLRLVWISLNLLAAGITASSVTWQTIAFRPDE